MTLIIHTPSALVKFYSLKPGDVFRYEINGISHYFMKTLETKKAPAAIGPYSQAKMTGNFLFASGQIPVDPATGEVAGDKIETQAEQSCKNVGAILEEAGLTFDNVIKTTCFLADMADFAAFNAVYEKYFTSKPARSCVAVKQLPKNVLCEVEAIAVAE